MLFIGSDVQDRMNLLGLTAVQLADKAFLEENVVDAIINNEVALEEIDEFELSLICSILHCKPEFFSNESIRERDLLAVAMNRGCDNEKSMNAKAKIQDFVNDFEFLNQVIQEEN